VLLKRNIEGICGSDLRFYVVSNDNKPSARRAPEDTQVTLLDLPIAVSCSSPRPYKFLPTIYFTTRPLPRKRTLAVPIGTGASILAADVFAGILLTARHHESAKERCHHPQDSYVLHTEPKVRLSHQTGSKLAA
jgi:hypothetical protein